MHFLSTNGSNYFLFIGYLNVDKHSLSDVHSVCSQHRRITLKSDSFVFCDTSKLEDSNGKCRFIQMFNLLGGYVRWLINMEHAWNDECSNNFTQIDGKRVARSKSMPLKVCSNSRRLTYRIKLKIPQNLSF